MAAAAGKWSTRSTPNDGEILGEADAGVTENESGGGLMSGQQQQADLVGGKGTLAEGGKWDGRSGPGGWVLAQGEGTLLSLHRVLDRARMYCRHLIGRRGQR